MISTLEKIDNSDMFISRSILLIFRFQNRDKTNRKVFIKYKTFGFNSFCFSLKQHIHTSYIFIKLICKGNENSV